MCNEIVGITGQRHTHNVWRVNDFEYNLQAESIQLVQSLFVFQATGNHTRKALK